MAIWQYQCGLAPPAVLGRADGDSDDESGWDRYQPPSGYEAVIESFAPQARAWSDAVLIWGEENGNRVNVVLDGRRVAAIVCRLDLRAFSRDFAAGILRLAAFCGCRLRDRTGRVYPAELPELLAAIQASDELRFVQDPHAFLEELSRRRRSGQRAEPGAAADGPRL